MAFPSTTYEPTHPAVGVLYSLERLAVLTPRPRVHLMLCHGVLAPRAAWPALVIQLEAVASSLAAAGDDKNADVVAGPQHFLSSGVIQFDDYGHWEAARRAVDEFLDRRSIRTPLEHVDYSGYRGGVRGACRDGGGSRISYRRPARARHRGRGECHGRRRSRFVRQTRLVAMLRAERRPPSDFASDGPVD